MPPQLPKSARVDKDATTVLRFAIGGKQYEVRPEEVAADLAGEVRNATGRSWMSHLSDLDEGGEADIDSIAALVLVATRQTGDSQTKWKKIARSISYDDLESLQIETDEGSDAEGEASAAS